MRHPVPQFVMDLLAGRNPGSKIRVTCMLERIVTGGQTGADQAGWRVARACGVPTGGWMPQGFLTEEGPRPEFAQLYGAREMPTDSSPERTIANVRDSDATLGFGTVDSPGAKATFLACQQLGESCMRIDPGGPSRPSTVARWIATGRFQVLNVAGNRESVNPGIGERVERFLAAVLRRLRHERIG
jgi:hypothetical protein